MTIGEFSAITGISAYTLRYYEKKGLLRVSRDSAGISSIILICGTREVTRWRSGWSCWSGTGNL